MDLSAFGKFAKYLANPLVLVGFVFFILVGLYKALIESDKIIAATAADSAQIMVKFLDNGFWLAGLVILLGFAYAFYQSRNESGIKKKEKNDERGVKTNQKTCEGTYLNELAKKEKELKIVNAFTPMKADAIEESKDKVLARLQEEVNPSYRLIKHSQNDVVKTQHERSEGDRESFDNLIDAFPKIQRAMLLGEPGAGKTFSLLKMVEDTKAKYKNRKSRPIPIFVRLALWENESQTLVAFIQEQMGSLGGYWENLLTEKRVLLLLDGLNELPVGQRDSKLPQISDWIKKYEEIPLLISCRELDYQGQLQLPLDRITIQPLEPTRIKQFLKNHYSLKMDAVEGARKSEKLFWEIGGGSEVEDCWRTFEKQGMTLDEFFTLSALPEKYTGYKNKSSVGWKVKEDWQRLVKTPYNLMHLVSNPFLLSIVLYIYRRSGSLPSNRAALFGNFVNMLLNREKLADLNEETNIVEPNTAGEKLITGIEALAWAMQTQAGTQAQERHAQLSLPQAAVLPLFDQDSVTAKDILVKAASATLLEVGKEVRFSHQLLQEYFTAQGMRKRIDERDLNASTLWPTASWWERTGWEESVILLAGLMEQDCSAVIEWLADANPEVAAQVINRCGADTPDKTKRWLQKKLMPRLTNLTTDPAPEARAAIGKALGSLTRNQDAADTDNAHQKLQMLDDRQGVGIIYSANKKRWLPDIKWIDITGDSVINEEDNESIKVDSFKIARYPVTYAQYQLFLEAEEGYHHPKWWKGLERVEQPGEQRFKFLNHPAENLSWYDAVAYCRWLSQLSGETVRLPSEWEWQLAATGGNPQRQYPWGEDYRSGYVNHDETFDKNGPHFLGGTSTVGIYPQGETQKSVADMVGNVWEWCEKRFDDRGDARVVRGGRCDTTTASTCVQRTATGTSLTPATTTLAFAWPKVNSR